LTVKVMSMEVCYLNGLNQGR